MKWGRASKRRLREEGAPGARRGRGAISPPTPQNRSVRSRWRDRTLHQPKGDAALVTVSQPSAEYQTEVIQLDGVEVIVVLDAGPRVLGYARRGGPQLFASLPGEVIDQPGGEAFSFVGGHRLWRAPEVPRLTYRSDRYPVAIDQLDRGVRLTGVPDVEGVAKTISLRQQGAVTVVDHTLLNAGRAPIRCAAWAITQLTPGGVAVLPQPLAPSDPDGVLPNRLIVLWPYTDPAAPEIALGASEVRVHASATRTRSKVGQPNRRGWMAYILGSEMFVKWSPLHDDALVYVDFGATIECYRDHRFLELESLSPLTELAPGAALHHREVWMLTELRGRSPQEVLASLPEQPAEMVD